MRVLFNWPANRAAHALFIYDLISGYCQSQFPRPGVRLHQQHSEMWCLIHRSLRPDTQLSSNKVRVFLLRLLSFISSFIAFIYIYLALTGYIQDWKYVKKGAKQSDHSWEMLPVSTLMCLQFDVCIFISFSSFFRGWNLPFPALSAGVLQQTSDPVLYSSINSMTNKKCNWRSAT